MKKKVALGLPIISSEFKSHLNPGKLIPFRASILAYPFPNRSTHPAPRIGIHSSNQNLEIPGRKSEADC